MFWITSSDIVKVPVLGKLTGRKKRARKIWAGAGRESVMPVRRPSPRRSPVLVTTPPRTIISKRKKKQFAQNKNLLSTVEQKNNSLLRLRRRLIPVQHQQRQKGQQLHCCYRCCVVVKKQIRTKGRILANSSCSTSNCTIIRSSSSSRIKWLE